MSIISLEALVDSVSGDIIKELKEEVERLRCRCLYLEGQADNFNTEEEFNQDYENGIWDKLKAKVKANEISPK